jgi:muramidase (phage lysozyme)
VVKVPLYQDSQDRVALRPEYTETLVGGATADAFGSAIGKGLQSVASGMDVAAEAVQRVQQMRNEAVVSDGANQWLQAKDKLLYDPDTGYANTQGRQAVEQFDAYQKSVQGLKRDIVAKMSPAQVSLFNKQVAPYETDALRSGYIKKAEETKKWLLQEHTAAAENFSQQAIQTPEDETRWNSFVGRGLQEIDARGAKEGWGEQRTQLERATYISNVRLQSALRINESDPIKAAKYATDHVSEITPQDHMVLLERLKPDLKAAASADAAHFNASNPAPGQFAAAGLSHDQYALLSVISGTESPAYDMMNGGQRIKDYAAHPGFIGAGGTTTATGRYQFVKGTWDMAAAALGLTDFSPASQDRAAAWLAHYRYRIKTRRDLANDIQGGNYASIRHGLEGTWEGLKKISDAEFSKRMGAARSAPLAAAASGGAAGGTSYATPGSGMTVPQATGPQFSEATESVLAGLPPAYADEIRESAADGVRAATVQRAARDKAAQAAQTDAYRLRIANGDPSLTAQDINADTVIDDGDKATLINAFNEKNRDALETQANVAALSVGKLVIDPYSDKGRKANDNVWAAIFSSAPLEKVDSLLLEQIRQTGAVPTQVGNLLRTNVASQKIDNTLGALNLGRRIATIQPGALGRMSGGAEFADDVTLYSHYVDDVGLTPEMAAQRIIDRKDPDKVRQRSALMDTKQMKDAIDRQATEGKVRGLYDKGLFSWAPNLGNSPRQAAAIVSDYKEILTESIFDAGGDVVAGARLAGDRLQRRYGTSEFAAEGANVVTYLPPEKTYPADATGSHAYIKEQLNADLAADGIKHGRVFLAADENTQDDYDTGTAPRYQLLYEDEKGVLRTYRKPFYAKPPTQEQVAATQKAALDKKLAELEAQRLENKREQRDYDAERDKAHDAMLALPQTMMAPRPARSEPTPGKPAPSFPDATPEFRDLGVLRKTKRRN